MLVFINTFMFQKPMRDCINPLTGEPFGDDYLWNGVLDMYSKEAAI